MRKTVLVIDDDRPILALMERMLQEFGFDAVLASSGDQALRRAEESRPAAVLLDLNMPGMSGREVIAKLREVGDPPVIIVSGEPVSRELMTSTGASAAFQKPFDMMALIRELQRLTSAASTR